MQPIDQLTPAVQRPFKPVSEKLRVDNLPFIESPNAHADLRSRRVGAPPKPAPPGADDIHRLPGLGRAPGFGKRPAENPGMTPEQGFFPFGFKDYKGHGLHFLV